MDSPRKRVKIGVFGHYGNQNLGDEAIIEAVIKNLREYIPGCEIVCLSINPRDSRERHNVDAFPIRYRRDFFQRTPSTETPSQPSAQGATRHTAEANTRGLKQTLKSIPVLGQTLKAAVRTKDALSLFMQEVRFLGMAKRYLRDIDLLLVTGSNQFLDNFGGPWGFPYTLCKWTLLAKSMNTKVAFISIGAGPLTRRASFWLLKRALKRADYVSYRDDGSKALIESRIDIDAPVYPDIAHSLGAMPSEAKPTLSETGIRVAVNPMPVYDSRYWHHPDDEKFNLYVGKMTRLCAEILTDGHRLDLFSTQSKDENVIDDIVSGLRKHPDYQQWSNNIALSKSKQVHELMRAIDNADVVVATRFHATVLPFQLGKPVLGVCYYRKAAELLTDVGLGEYKVDIDDFDADTLIGKYRALVQEWRQGTVDIEQPFTQYTEALARQYHTIASLVTSQKHEENERGAAARNSARAS